jgi:hypothetical protein
MIVPLEYGVGKGSFFCVIDGFAIYQPFEEE